ncbi:hypothetical protein EV426DRAFT_681910 [Tirmania nivea]|nr:hypothetical protein EV426DRAFT_681910 [Tirmania nivea]
MLLSLPAELQCQILGYLSCQEYLALTLTSKCLRALVLPYIYDTIYLSTPEEHLDEKGKRFFQRYKQLLRSLVNNPTLAGYIHTIELIRWNNQSIWAGISDTTDVMGVLFTEAEMQELNCVLLSMGYAMGEPPLSFDPYPVYVSIPSGLYTSVALGTRDFTEAKEAASTWMGQLGVGNLDATFAVLLFLVNDAQTDMQRGLCQLRLKLEDDGTRKQPECLWWLFWHLIVKNPESETDAISNHDHRDDSSQRAKAFPWLQSVEIVATKIHQVLSFLWPYDCDIRQIAIPFLLHPTLSELALTLLDKSSTGSSILSHPSSTSIQLSRCRSLYLQITNLNNFRSILSCTPNLSNLTFVYLQSGARSAEETWLDVDILGASLAFIRESLTTLTLRTVCLSSNWEPDMLTLGKDFGLELNLQQFRKLRTLKTGLTLLLGIGGGMTLADALPEGLEVLGLFPYISNVDYIKGIARERDESATEIKAYLEERGKAAGGELKKLVLPCYKSDDACSELPKLPESPKYCIIWPGKAATEKIHAAARAAGVLIEYEVDQLNQRWWRDISGLQRPNEFEQPCHNANERLEKISRILRRDVEELVIVAEKYMDM